MKPLTTVCAPIIACLLLMVTSPSVVHAQSGDFEDIEQANNTVNLILVTGVVLALGAIIYSVATRDDKKKEERDQEREVASDSTASQVASLDRRAILGTQSADWQERLQQKEARMPVRLFVVPRNHYDRGRNSQLGFSIADQSVVVGVAVTF